MRKLFALALAASALSVPTTAFAKKDKSAQAAPAPLAMKETGIAKIDETFAKAKAPLDTISKVRTEVDGLTANVASALGLTAGAPIADALADLKAKAAGKLTLAMDGGKPKVSAADGVPDNVKAAIDALNAGIDNVKNAVAALSEVPAQLTAVADDAKQYSDPAVLQGLVGDNPAAVMKAPKAIAQNLETLTKAPEEAKAVALSADNLIKTVTTTLAN